MSITAAQLNEIEHNVFVTHASTLEQEASTLSIDDIRSGIVDTRRVQRTVLTKLPEQAFSAQQLGEGEETWSAGQIVTHLANSFGSMSDFLRLLLGLPEAAHVPRNLAQQMTRVEALALHDTTDASFTALFASVLSHADLSHTSIHPLFGELSARSTLLVVLIHEANHRDQLQRLSGVV